MDFSQVITDSMSGDRNRRVVAEQNLQSFKEQNFVNLFIIYIFF